MNESEELYSRKVIEKSEPQHAGFFSEIETCLVHRNYKSEKIQGRSYWLWQLQSSSLNFYVRRSPLGKSSTIYFDARFIELKELLAKIKDIVPPSGGMTPNTKFELFQIKRKFVEGEHDGQAEHEGWKFRFKNKQACDSFLDICEAFASHGIQAAETKASEFNQTPLRTTSKSATIESRVGQAKFRKDLLNYWKGCAVTGCKVERLLRASHIKPWSVASSAERLDAFNGLLLVPNLDALFDDGLISFSKQGRIIISSQLPDTEYSALGIVADMRLRKNNGAHALYLAYHFENIFKQ